MRADDVPLLLLLLASIVSICLSAALKPQHMQCPLGMILGNGVRTVDGPLGDRGSFECTYPPVGGDEDAITGKSTATQPPGAYGSRIYCTNGTRPILVNFRTVGCQR